ncbi:MAG: DUF494 domain-containing protein [Gammaproteobacteria bacterium]|nr:DUF494 domain-containing protein [Gammaproteobacteria bacterium]
MKESVLDVLMYLFETYIGEDIEPEPDRNILRIELENAGFNNQVVSHALEWLDDLGEGDDDFDYAVLGNSTRIFNSREIRRLDVDCRGYIVYLEQIGILNATQRERVLDRIFALAERDIDIEDIKWVVLMVLFTQPGQEDAYARMEDLVFEEKIGSIH